MNIFEKKIPRGVIYHSLMQSTKYLFQSLFCPLDLYQTVDQFEKEFSNYCGLKHCVAFPFARTAIYFILKELNLPVGSEVLLPPITIKGIVDVVVDLGLVPVYVESDLDTISFDIKSLKDKISSNVRVAIITPLFGLVPNIALMVEILREHKVFVIEDFSQCINGLYEGKRVGTFGDVGVYSASSIKTLDTLGGGLVVTDSAAIYQNLVKAVHSLNSPNRSFLVKKAWINLVRNIATSKFIFSLFTFRILQVIRSINPDSALKQTGHRNKSRISSLPKLWFSRYSSVQARIGLSLIKKLNFEDRERIANAEQLKEIIGLGRFPKTTPLSTNVYWQLILLVPNANQAQDLFAKKGVDVATSSLELVCALSEYPNRENLSNAEKIYRDGIFIPCFPNLNAVDMKRVGLVTRQYFAGIETAD